MHYTSAKARPPKRYIAMLNKISVITDIIKENQIYPFPFTCLCLMLRKDQIEKIRIPPDKIMITGKVIGLNTTINKNIDSSNLNITIINGVKSPAVKKAIINDKTNTITAHLFSITALKKK